MNRAWWLRIIGQDECFNFGQSKRLLLCVPMCTLDTFCTIEIYSNSRGSEITTAADHCRLYPSNRPIVLGIGMRSTFEFVFSLNDISFIKHNSDSLNGTSRSGPFKIENPVLVHLRCCSPRYLLNLLPT